MPKSTRRIRRNSGAQVVELVRAGRTPEEMSGEFEPSAQAIWNWVRQARRDAGLRQDGMKSPERGAGSAAA